MRDAQRQMVGEEEKKRQIATLPPLSVWVAHRAATVSLPLTSAFFFSSSFLFVLLLAAFFW